MNDDLFKHNLLFASLAVTEKAAIAAYSHMGYGDEKAADQLAVDAMRQALNEIEMRGVVVIGEGERDQAPMLYIGEKVGTGRGVEVDIALDPLEGTTILATGRSNSLAVAAFGAKGSFLHAPDTYMDKIAIGCTDQAIVDLDNSVEENLHNVTKFLNKPIQELVIVILDRSRHQKLISQVRLAGARIRLINDGDIAAVILASTKNSGVDIYMGSGGAPEGVLAAAALASLGGMICTRLIFNNDDEKARASKMGIQDFNKKYYLNDLVSGEVIFTATGVTDGNILKGIVKTAEEIQTHSIVMHSTSKTIRYVNTKYLLKPKA